MYSGFDGYVQATAFYNDVKKLDRPRLNSIFQWYLRNYSV
ncbi:hypothetical protein ACFSF3_00245 [Vibrio chagasii]